MANNRILVASGHGKDMSLFVTNCFEFSSIIEAAGDVDLVAPKRRKRSFLGDKLNRVANKLRRVARKPRRIEMEPYVIEDDYEFFFFVCLNVDQLVDVPAFVNRQDKCRKSAVMLLEVINSELASQTETLRLLDTFDHVFAFSRHSAEALQQYTKTPCSFLPGGADCLATGPASLKTERPINVYSMGRRSEDLHRQFRSWSDEGDFFYVYDIGHGLTAYSLKDARALTLSMIRRAQYFICYNMMVGPKAKLLGGKDWIPFRFFEGAAGGAVMIGSRPECSEFKDLFDWPDAVIDMPEDPASARPLLESLNRDPRRVTTIRYRNMVEALRRHDWVHRWENVLVSMSVAVPAGVMVRKSALEERIVTLSAEYEYLINLLSNITPGA